jgi:hypothetical protein
MTPPLQIETFPLQIKPPPILTVDSETYVFTAALKTRGKELCNFGILSTLIYSNLYFFESEKRKFMALLVVWSVLYADTYN